MPDRTPSDLLLVTVERADLEFVLEWAEGGLAEYNRDDRPEVERVRQALRDALLLSESPPYEQQP